MKNLKMKIEKMVNIEEDIFRILKIQRLKIEKYANTNGGKYGY